MPRGFHNARIKNSKRESSIYTDGEQLFLNYALKHGISKKHLIHEKPIKLKIDSKRYKFFLDFFHTLTRINIEINPLFHYQYCPVIDRDKLKRKLLKSRLHIKQLCVKLYCSYKKGIASYRLDKQDLLDAIKTIKKSINSNESLDFYIKR